ncbi:hypothetical protein Godav_011906, partial [Gossypium davidsonii]|nr:hypothetical protein [Gossypium davidsonii]MBA0646323.1 hypothetical protein [Gossypium klotzschianum]
YKKLWGLNLYVKIKVTIWSCISEVNETKKRALTNTKKVVKWKKPLGMVIKFNFDRAYDRQRFRLASGIIARNTEGEVLISKSETYRGSFQLSPLKPSLVTEQCKWG